MGRIVNTTFISVDGVIETPHLWPELEGDDDTSDTHTRLLLASDAVLMGRRTYETFASAWPERSGDPFSDRINSIQKYVVSSTLQDAAWSNTTVIGGDVVGKIRRIKEQEGGNLVQYGFGQLSHTLLDNDLLDELRLSVHPFLIRRGGPSDLLYREGPLRKLKLIDATTLASGIVTLYYEVRREQ